MPAKFVPPKYCRQREKNRSHRAYVMVDGKRHQLGEYGSPESYQRYAELIANKATEPEAEPAPTPTPAPTAPTVARLMADYLEYAQARHGGPKASEVVQLTGALKVLRSTHAETLAKDFGPKAFQQMRLAMIQRDWSRNYINEQCGRIKHMFGWGVIEEILPGDARHRLDAVPGLQMGEHGVRETEPKKPVPDEDVQDTVAELPDVVADMVRLMVFLGCRPGELCQVSNKYIDRSSDVWLFRPPTHKTQKKGKKRIIAIGPQAQAILQKYLFQDPCFRYSSSTFKQAVYRACERAGVQQWHPNRLRHNAATNVRSKFGLDVAQCLLGHSKASTTEIYAELDASKAMAAVRAIG